MPTSPKQAAPTWDIFCKVIDNFGDIGVCWRLATQLAQRGLRVRLWVDDARALAWMAPQPIENMPTDAATQVQVCTWDANAPTRWLALQQGDTASDVWIEGFGCDISDFIANYDHLAVTSGNFSLKIAINLEYLSAEGFVARTHGLASPVRLQHAPPEAVGKWFFYPGFTANTGGLLREMDLMERQVAFDSAAWLATQSKKWGATLGNARNTTQAIASRSVRLISLFCYDNAALPALLTQLMEGPERSMLLVTQGKAAAAVRALLATPVFEHLSPMSPSNGHSMLSIVYLPALSQTDFDHLLWSCDLNLVRGEDSLVRALWAGKPFVWQIYPQDDGAHHAKLQAFLDWLSPTADWRAAFLAWNTTAASPQAAPEAPEHPSSGFSIAPSFGSQSWQTSAHNARARLLDQNDLCSQLMAFVAKKRLKS